MSRLFRWLIPVCIALATNAAFGAVTLSIYGGGTTDSVVDLDPSVNPNFAIDLVFSSSPEPLVCAQGFLRCSTPGVFTVLSGTYGPPFSVDPDYRLPMPTGVVDDSFAEMGALTTEVNGTTGSYLKFATLNMRADSNIYGGRYTLGLEDLIVGNGITFQQIHNVVTCYLTVNAQPAPLAIATQDNDAFVDGNQTLPSGNTSVYSLKVQNSAQLTIQPAEQLNAINGVTLETGSTLLNSGTVAAALTNNGDMQVGASAGKGTMNALIDGDYTQSATGQLSFELGGDQQGVNYDSLHVTRKSYLEGVIDLVAIDGFTPTYGSVFDLLISDGGITIGSAGLQMSSPDFTWMLVNDGTTLQATYLPEPASLAMLAVAGLLIRNRRTRQA